MELHFNLVFFFNSAGGLEDVALALYYGLYKTCFDSTNNKNMYFSFSLQLCQRLDMLHDVLLE